MADHDADAPGPEGAPGPDGGPGRVEQRRRTEARILAAATRLFVDSGYERTTIRGIAAAAEVDPGLVMHYFGSKQALFQQVTHGSPPPDLTGTARQVGDELLARLAESMEHEPVHSLALLRSMLTNPEAAATLQDGAAQYRAQISRAIGTPDAPLRAELVTALILGVVVSRHLLKSGALTEASPAKIIDLLRPCLGPLMAAEPD